MFRDPKPSWLSGRSSSSVAWRLETNAHGRSTESTDVPRLYFLMINIFKAVKSDSLLQCCVELDDAKELALRSSFMMYKVTYECSSIEYSTIQLTRYRVCWTSACISPLPCFKSRSSAKALEIGTRWFKRLLGPHLKVFIC